ncbi:fungal-specific transcription factor domain-containing protein [Aspergillus coremiiformis]|uniref:Fungal-specific transcription factor domain-containing protein n=1 Tax=Aspergillus coremiiformis TaxID=138285 RepID=A0A5N6Z009_9EURO|nr:fungal-specific transcription factor domain-containing protein [Aspergillus coremiiformis]
MPQESARRVNMKKRLPGTPCCVCRLKRKRCDRQKPACGECRKRDLHDECSYRPEDMPPPHQRRQRKPLQSSPGLDVVFISTPTVDSRSRVTRLGQSPDFAQEDLIEISSVASDQSYHTAVLPEEISFQLTGSGVQPPQVVRLQRAVEDRTGRVKDEDMAGDVPLLTQIPMFTTGVLQPSVSGSNGECPPVHLSQDMADRLVISYIMREFANLPILDLLEFQSAYKTIRTEQDITAGRSSFHGILNTIFSLSSLSTSDVSDEDVASLFHRGQKISKDTENSGSLRERIQSHILQSQYLYATGNPKLAWMFIGFAIRMAQVLRLNFQTGGGDTRGRRDRELARRLWHSAMILERIIALQIGLPPQTSNPLRVPLPTHMDTDYIDFISGGNSAANVERPSLIEFLTACTRLYSHVEDILAWEDELRMQPNSCAAKKLLAFDFKIFLKVDTLLYDWQASLPSSLREAAAGGIWDDPVVCRQRNVLRARYLYIRLRLYRPLLILGLALSTKCNCRSGGRPHATKEETTVSSSPVIFSMVRDASIKSVGVALELVTLIKAHEDGPLDGSPDDNRRSLISPYWENIDYIYAGGTVLLAARLSNFTSFHNDNADTLNEGEVETCLTQAIDMLDRYHNLRPDGRVARVARLCCNTLKDLSDVIRGPDIVDTSADATAVLDENTRNRLLERMENGSPALNRNRRQSVEDTCGYYGWVESLPIDLAGPLE